jgi:hypothetical protein
METHRQWSERAIARTTPASLALYSIVTLCARQMQQVEKLPVRQAAWYQKAAPTFADALAIVRRAIWSTQTLSMSRNDSDIVKILHALLLRLTETLSYAA